jgi:hypothetical protein
MERSPADCSGLSMRRIDRSWWTIVAVAANRTASDSVLDSSVKRAFAPPRLENPRWASAELETS